MASRYSVKTKTKTIFIMWVSFLFCSVFIINGVANIIASSLMMTIFFGAMIFDKIADKIQRKEDINNDIIYRENQEHDNDRIKSKNLVFDLEKKRKELEIEFEHYYKVAMLNAQIDERKMRRLEQMKREFAQEKTHGIDALNSQIDRLRKMAYED